MGVVIWFELRMNLLLMVSIVGKIMNSVNWNGSQVVALIFSTYLPESQIKKEKKYSNKFFDNFHMSESSFTYSGQVG